MIDLKNKLAKLEHINKRNNDEIILIKEDYRLKEYVFIEELAKQKDINNSKIKQQNDMLSPVLKKNPGIGVFIYLIIYYFQ